MQRCARTRARAGNSMLPGVARECGFDIARVQGAGFNLYAFDFGKRMSERMPPARDSLILHLCDPSDGVKFFGKY